MATSVRLANGQHVMAMLGNIDLTDPVQIEHFLVLSVVKPNDDRFDLARYFDVDYDRRGPKELAAFLELQVDEVFPISFDITNVADGLAACTQGSIPAMPRARLSQAELIELAVGNAP